MKLKRWFEIVLSIISIISGMFMMINPEISVIPFIVGGTIFVITTGIICEYGTLFNKLSAKIDKFIGQ